jgi:dTDP-glucose 4,6-dehydratase
MQVVAYHETYGLPALITRGSNTYGPYQYPEKMLPLFITNAIRDKPIPMYGDGLYRRDWLHVDDHCTGIDTVLRAGVPGEAYNIGGGSEHTNREVTDWLLAHLGKPGSLVRQVTDRPGHDRRYALDCAKASRLGWRPVVPFEEGLRQTVAWYQAHRAWWEPIVTSGEYTRYYQRQYAHR